MTEPGFGTQPTAEEAEVLEAAERQVATGLAKAWWLFLITGAAWVFISLIVLQFDAASIDLVGLLIGLMFLFTGIEQFFVGAATPGGWKWLWFLFGVIFVAAGVFAIFNPATTTAALADSLGFLFLLVAIFWIVEAFVSKGSNDLWWLGLVSGVLMLILAFWVAGQFFFEKVYVLLVFAGIWALLHGVTDFVRAFQLRALGKAAAR